MGANDDHAYPWLTPTKDLIRWGAAHAVPVLGICLGHQLAAAALGGEVVVNPAGARRGVLEMSWSEAGADPVVGSCGGSAVFWHRDVVTRLPEGTQVLARAQSGELAAARFAPSVWGLQCHPEARPDIVTGWAAKDRALAVAADEVADVDQALAAVTDARASWSSRGGRSRPGSRNGYACTPGPRPGDVDGDPPGAQPRHRVAAAGAGRLPRRRVVRAGRGGPSRRRGRLAGLAGHADADRPVGRDGRGADRPRRGTPFVLLVLTAVQILLHLLFARIDAASASCAIVAGGHHHVTAACAPVPVTPRRRFRACR